MEHTDSKTLQCMEITKKYRAQEALERCGGTELRV